MDQKLRSPHGCPAGDGGYACTCIRIDVTRSRVSERRFRVGRFNCRWPTLEAISAQRSRIVSSWPTNPPNGRRLCCRLTGRSPNGVFRVGAEGGINQMGFRSVLAEPALRLRGCSGPCTPQHRGNRMRLAKRRVCGCRSNLGFRMDYCVQWRPGAQ